MISPTDYIKDNTVKIYDSKDQFYGSAFLLDDTIAVTCHHNIYLIDNIIIGNDDKKIPAKWIKESSIMDKDLALLDYPFFFLIFPKT